MILRSIGWAAAGLSTLAAAQIAAARPFGYDLVAYLDAARRLVEGQPLYPLAAQETIYLGAGEYLYPPTSAIGFVPLALLPLDVATLIWTAALVVLAAWIAYDLIRPMPRDVRPWALAAYALYLPLIAEITLGNLDLVTLALCLVAWRWRERPVAGGTALALAVGSKLLPVALPFFFVTARAWRTLAVFALVAIGSILATLPWLADAWPTYVRLLLQINGAPPAEATTLVPAVVPAARLILPLASVLVVLVAGHLARRVWRAPFPYAVALAALPLAAPGIWYPYLVFALPLLATLLRSPTRTRVVAAVVAFVALEIPKRSDGADVAFIGLLLLITVGLAYAVRGDGAEVATAPSGR